MKKSRGAKSDDLAKHATVPPLPIQPFRGFVSKYCRTSIVTYGRAPSC